MVLAAWGASDLRSATSGYEAVLAAPVGRRLALLVGINQYPAGSALAGCITDVELQRELLIHRFGLKAADILTLTDQQATRTAIATAFVDHLIRQARSGDGVVFHFSGLGSTVTGSIPNSTQASFVTAEAIAPEGEVPLVNDMLEETLRLLLRSLQTDRVTTILDTSHHYPGHPLQGNLRVRAFANPAMAQPSPAELVLQQQLLKSMGGNRDRVASNPNTAFPGVVLRAGELATEVHWSQFSAGLFTYTLTQTLWQSLPASTVQVALAQVNEQIGQLTNQQSPQLSGQKSQESELVPYFFNPAVPGADGIVTAIEEPGKTIHLWLGGLPIALVEYYGANSLVTLQPETASTTAATPIHLQILSRDGLTARARLYRPDQTSDFIDQAPPVHIGQGVQEAVRVLPRQIGLTVALDDTLERIERVDAISALSAIPHISAAIAGEHPADCLLSKIPTSEITQVAALPTAALHGMTTPATISYGLFSQGRDIILNTTGEGGEAIKRAVHRLVPKLQTLLANKWLNLTTNEQTSQLGVRATLELLTPAEKPLTHQDTVRHPASVAQKTAQKLQNLPISADAIAPLAAGSRIRYRVENYSDRPLYLLLLTINSSNQLVPIYIPMAQPISNAADSSPPAPVLMPGDSLTLPTLPLGIDWAVQGPEGLATAYLICSQSPFPQTLATLTSGQRSTSDFALGSAIANPLEVTQAILQDLHQGDRASYIPNSSDYWLLDTATWATFRFVYQVV